MNSFDDDSEPNRDRELAERMLQGDRQAWQQFFDTYAKPLFVYAYHRTGGDALAAEDVRQETLLAAARDMASYRRDEPLFAWLCGIARHKAADELRRRRPEVSLEVMLDESRQAEPLLSTAAQLGGEPLPDELVERAETRSQVVEALWCLPAEYREALEARYVQGEGVEAIAVRLRRSYKATESLLSRARQAFRHRWMEVEQREQHPERR